MRGKAAAGGLLVGLGAVGTIAAWCCSAGKKNKGKTQVFGHVFGGISILFLLLFVISIGGGTSGASLAIASTVLMTISTVVAGFVFGLGGQFGTKKASSDDGGAEESATRRRCLVTREYPSTVTHRRLVTL